MIWFEAAGYLQYVGLGLGDEYGLESVVVFSVAPESLPLGAEKVVDQTFKPRVEKPSQD